MTLILSLSLSLSLLSNYANKDITIAKTNVC